MRSTDGVSIRSLHGRLSQLLGSSFMRFFAASLFGLGFDVGLATVLNRYAGIALIPAAAISLLVAAVMMYFVHEFWTFRGGQRRISAKRMAGTVGSALAALALRSACLYSTSEFLGLGGRLAPLQLLFATGLSFVLNYLVVRRIVSTRSRTS